MADDASFDPSPDVLTSTAQGRLRSLVERLERLAEDKQAVMGDMKEVFAEAKGEGYDVKVLPSRCHGPEGRPMSREPRLPSLWVPALLLSGLIIFVAVLCSLARPDGDLPSPVRSQVQ